jgi:hypothetical protein
MLKKESKSFILELPQIETCGLYCQGAFDCGIPMYSSIESFQNVQESNILKTGDFFMSRLLDEKKILDEERCYLSKIKQHLSQTDLSIYGVMCDLKK